MTASDSTTLESNKSVFPMVAHRSKGRATATGPGAFAVDAKGSRLNSGWNVPMAVSCHCRPRCHTRRSKPVTSSSVLALRVAGMVILYDREPERVLDDVLDGLISVETAHRDFGVVLTPALTIDTDATALARAAPPVYRPSARS